MRIEDHPDFIPPKVAEAAIACLRGAHTVRAIAFDIDVWSSSTAHKYVRGAADLGLIDIPHGVMGGTRPGVGVAASSYRSIRPRSGHADA